MLVIELNVFMVILLSLVAVHAFYRLERKGHAAHRLFLALICLTILILILEIFSVLLNSSTYVNFITVHKLVDTIGFLLAPLPPILTLLFIYKRTSKYKNITRKSILRLSAPFVVNGILALGSFNYNWIFAITNENIYVRGPLWLVSPMTSCFYYVLNFLLLVKVRKKLSREELLVLSLFTLIPSLLSIFQLYYVVYLTIWNSVAIAVVVNYIFIIHSQIKIDPLTRLGNRIAYDEYLAIQSRKNNISLAVINIDLDDFKNINDAFGHHEGDKVLKVFARCLGEVFDENGVAIRLGGDEFIVFVHENRREIVEKHIEALKNNVNAYNRTSSRPYYIRFSYGVAIFNDTYKNIQELIKHSDRLMYEEKNKLDYSPIFDKKGR